MTLGSILLQPQTLARMEGRTPGADFADEVLALAHRLALDPAALEAVFPAFETAAQAFGARLEARVTQKLPAALAGIRDLFTPLLDRFAALGEGDAPATPTALLERIAAALEALAAATDGLSDDAIRATVRRALDLLGSALGLDQTFVRDEVQRFLADLRAALLAGVTAMAPAPAATRIAMACLLRRIEAELLPLLPVFDLDVDRLAGLLIGVLRRSGVADVRDQAACVLGKIKAVLTAVAAMARGVAEVSVQPRNLPTRGLAPSPQPGEGARSAIALVPAAALTPALSRRREREQSPRSMASRAVPGDPPRSIDGTYCWYASWLYATRRQGWFKKNNFGTGLVQTITPGYPEDEVWLSADKTKLILRRAGGPDEILDEKAAPFEWYEAKQFAGPPSTEFFTTPRLRPPFLESWAQVTAVLAEAVAGLWHVIAMATSPKEHATNIPIWLWNWSRAASSGIAAAPLPSLVAQKAGWSVGGKYPLSPLVTMLSVVFGSLEGVHTKTNAGNAFLQWLTLLGGDAINAFTVSTVTQTLRDLSLSLFTMINYTGGDGRVPVEGDDLRPKNWDMGGPWIGAVNFLFGKMFFALIRREDHGLPTSGDPSRFILWWLLGAPIAAAVGAFSGTLVTWGISRTATPKMLWAEPAKAAVLSLFTHIVQMYTSMEGDTDGGKYNPTVQPDGTPWVPARQPFAGYPAAETSPYRLPYAQGVSIFVGQANQGFFSHMRYNNNPQVYAYDFAHDFQDEVLAVRDGTVVDYFDWMPDDQDLSSTNPSDAAAIAAAVAAAAASGFLLTNQTTGTNGGWNFVLIRHDTVDNAHDKDQAGVVVQTYAQYGHGANGGVRAAFALRGIAGGAIIGAQVLRGQVVMQAGDTGVSFHNHLHLHVLGAVAGTPAPLPGTPQVVNRNQLTPYTLPFVFKEATHILGADGPLRYLTWYTSDNPRLG